MSLLCTNADIDKICKVTGELCRVSDPDCPHYEFSVEGEEEPEPDI